MESPDRSEKDDAQKAKLIFFTLAVLVTILLIWSFYTASKAKQERDKAKQETEQLTQETSRLEQMLKDQNVVNDQLKMQLQSCESRVKAKPAAKKPSAAKKTTKKTSKTKKTR